MLCFHASDLHGRVRRYEALFAAIERERPDAVFLGGDLLPSHGFAVVAGEPKFDDFFGDFVVPRLAACPGERRVFAIPGNDDPKCEDPAFWAGEQAGVWEYLDGRATDLGEYRVFGYPYVPPTPFGLKDWERYDVSRYTDPGCVSPEEGSRTVAVRPGEVRHATIAADLDQLTGGADLTNALFLFHTPPYQTHLDRAALDGKMIDHVPLDVHVGSIAVKRFIERRQPLITMHGHIHESTRITGEWQDAIGRTRMYQAAHHGPELALVRFDPKDPAAATLELLP